MTSDWSYLNRALVSMAFLFIAIAVYIARSNPAQQYELSIYEGTPLVVWVTLLLALLIAVWVLFYVSSKLGITIGILVILSWMSMRHIRGYYLVGRDPLVHYGRVQNILTSQSPFEIFYPAMHVFTVQLSLITEIDSRVSLHIVAFATLITFLLLFTVTVAVLDRGKNAERYAIGGGLSLLVLPINWMGTHMHPHPSSLAILFLPLLVYVTFRALQPNNETYTAIAGLFLLFLVFQHALIALLAAALIAGMAFGDYALHKIKHQKSAGSNYRVLGVLSLLSLVSSTYYTIQHEIPQAAIRQTLLQILYPATQGKTTTDQAQDAADLGFNPIALALKVAGVDLLLTFAALVIAIVSFWTWYRGQGGIADWTVLILSASTVPLIGGFIVFLIAGFSLYFRILGILVLISGIIVGVKVLSVSVDKGSRSNYNVQKSVCTIGIALLLLVSLTVALPSPFILQSSGHVTESKVSAAGTAYSHGISPEKVVVTRSDYSRLVHAATGSEEPRIRIVPPDRFNDHNLTDAFDEDRYLLQSTHDYETDVVLYDGFRFSERDYAYLERDENIHVVMDSGDTQILFLKAG